MRCADADHYFKRLTREYKDDELSQLKDIEPFLKAAFKEGQEATRIRETRPWIVGWGGVLILVCLFVLVAVISSLNCTYDMRDGEVILKTCPSNWRYAVYAIMKDWGSGIGIVGAGADLAWSTFYKG